MAEARWSRFGPLIWLRLRALGAPASPADVRAVLCDLAPSDLRVALFGSTRVGLEQPGVPDDAALRVFCANAAQTRCMLAAQPNDRLPVLLSMLDGLDPDDVAQLIGGSASAVRASIASVGELDRLADPPLEGTQPGGHLNTLELVGFAREELGDLLQPQMEQHVAGCSLCFRRFEAYTQAVEAFADLPLPPPPAPPPDRRPLWILGAFSVFGALAVFGIVGVLLVTTQEGAEQAAAFREQATSVDLLVGGKAVSNLSGVGPDALVGLAYDAHGAAWTAVLGRSADRVEVVYRGEVSGVGRYVPPMELIGAGQRFQTLYVVLADEPLGQDVLIGAVDGAVPGGASITVVPLH